MTTISDNLQGVRERLARVCQATGRDVNAVTLLAVSKTFGPEDVAAAVRAGQRCFGENYVQEGVEKSLVLRGLFPELGLEWHCIGPVQSNKTRLVAAHFDWVLSVDRLKTAQRLSEQRPDHLPDLQMCLQVNVDGGANKSGVSLDEVPELAQAVSALPRLRLRGLMTIPEPSRDPNLQRAAFRRLRELLGVLQAQGLPMDTLSMGMSEDMEAAVAEGATLVRVGRAIFGDRPAKEVSISSATGSA